MSQPNIQPPRLNLLLLLLMSTTVGTAMIATTYLLGDYKEIAWHYSFQTALQPAASFGAVALGGMAASVLLEVSYIKNASRPSQTLSLWSGAASCFTFAIVWLTYVLFAVGNGKYFRYEDAIVAIFIFTAWSSALSWPVYRLAEKVFSFFFGRTRLSVIANVALTSVIVSYVSVLLFEIAHDADDDGRSNTIYYLLSDPLFALTVAGEAAAIGALVGWLFTKTQIFKATWTANTGVLAAPQHTVGA